MIDVHNKTIFFLSVNDTFRFRVIKINENFDNSQPKETMYAAYQKIISFLRVVWHSQPWYLVSSVLLHLVTPSERRSQVTKYLNNNTFSLHDYFTRGEMLREVLIH